MIVNSPRTSRQRTLKKLSFPWFLVVVAIANGLLVSRTWQLWTVEEEFSTDSDSNTGSNTNSNSGTRARTRVRTRSADSTVRQALPQWHTRIVEIENVDLNDYLPLASWTDKQTIQRHSIADIPISPLVVDPKIPSASGSGSVSAFTSTSTSTSTSVTATNISICLLIKDDNDILNEWIAYHYHLWNLRQLIVAVDPSSNTSPQHLLEQWHMDFGLDYQLWNDKRFMPDFFLQKRYDLVPRMIKFEDKNATKWKDSHEQSTKELQIKLVRINNHRYRQSKFLQHCAKAIQESTMTLQTSSFAPKSSLWMTHIDTDEYIALNPTLVHGQESVKPIPTKPTSGSLLAFLERTIQQDSEIVNWPCISMPRILYGSVEDTTTTATKVTKTTKVTTTASQNSNNSNNYSDWNPQRFETIRWKYHADFNNRELNKQPKVIMDVAGFPPFNVSRKAFSIHRPSSHLCRMSAQMNVHDFERYPLVVHHYLGSLERYQARQDPRRTLASYHQKADIKEVKNENDWMNGWLTEFVTEHGMDKVSKVLWQYRANREENSLVQHEEWEKSNDPNTPKALGKTLSLDEDSLSACLLVKDDNDILNEWIAYHHHVLKLRTLIVAVDPSSNTSPSALLQPWRALMDDIQLWTDNDFMPAFFIDGKYDQVPNLMGNTTSNSTYIYNADEVYEEQVQEDLIDINNHRFRQVTFLSSCVKYLKKQNKTWMIHIDTDEFVTLHPQIRNQDHWRQLPLDPEIRRSFLLRLLKDASREYSKGLSYPCVSMPRLLYGSKEDPNDAGYVSKLPPEFNGTNFETIRWKYHASYDVDDKLNGKPKAILDLSGIPPQALLLKNKIFSIHRPGLHLCKSDRKIFFDAPHRFPLTINHYIGSWERYNHRNDARRSRSTYDAKAPVHAGKDNDWIDGWIASFVQEHGMATAKRLLANYATSGTEVEEVDDHDLEGDDVDDESTKDRVLMNITDENRAEIMKALASTKQIEFSACLLVKDDNEILNEWIAYHYHVLGLRYMIVAIDAKSQTSPSALLHKWRQFGMQIEEWSDEMFMPDIYFQKAYHLQPRLVKIKKNKNKWLEGINDRQVKRDYYNTIQDHRFRQITFLASCIKRLRDLGRTWMIHIDTDEYIVINPKLREEKVFGARIPIPLTAEASIIPRLLNEMIVDSWTTLNYPCISLPRLLFGSIEDSSSISVPTGYNHSRFESLRWKYHTDFDDSYLNKQPKVIMDVSAIPINDKIFAEGRVFSIHRPSQMLCRTQGQMRFADTDHFPFSVNHYLGTFERFDSRDDPRRNRKLYDQKANVTAGKEDDKWILSWLPTFIEQQGNDKVARLLQDYRSR